jgi:hypothetical protein
MIIVYIVLTALYLLITHKFSKAVVADMAKRKTDKQGVIASIIVWVVSLFWPVWLMVGIADFLMSDKEK